METSDTTNTTDYVILIIFYHHAKLTGTWKQVILQISKSLAFM
jgi:hypothetical protein